MVKVGILGTGFGKVHAEIYKKLDGVEIAGIFGRTMEKLNELKEQLDVKVTTNIDELINDPQIDLIDVCLPTPLHKEYVIKALKSGKHVFCETPVCYSLEEALEMKMYAEKYNKMIFVDLFFKFSDPHRIAIERVKSNSLGRPLVVTAYQKTPPYWGKMNLTQTVKDFMLHNFDFVTEIKGAPIEVMASGIENGNSHVFSTLKYEDGIAQVESSTMLPGKFPFSIGFNIICEFGTLTFDAKFGETTEQSLVLYRDGEMEHIDLPDNNDWEEAIKHVISHVSNNTSSSIISIDAAIKSLKIVLAIKDSLNNKSFAAIN